MRDSIKKEFNFFSFEKKQNLLIRLKFILENTSLNKKFPAGLKEAGNSLNRDE